MTGAALEREIKVPCDDLASVRERLQQAGATLEQPYSDERNWIYDREVDEQLELASNGRLLRLRRDHKGCRLTFKGPAVIENGVKVREERETHLSDPEEAGALLVGLGFRVVRRYEKRRESWRLDDSEVSLDETPIGTFVEIEGGDVLGVASVLGIDPARAERSSYLALWERHRQSHPEAGPDMVFLSGPAGDGDPTTR